MANFSYPNVSKNQSKVTFDLRGIELCIASQVQILWERG